MKKIIKYFIAVVFITTLFYFFRFELLKLLGYQLYTGSKNFTHNFMFENNFKCNDTLSIELNCKKIKDVYFFENNFQDKSKTIILMNGRNSSYYSMSNGMDYTRGLYQSLFNYSKKHNINFIFLPISSQRFSFNSINSDQLDFNNLNTIVNSLINQEKIVIIGMSYGGILSEYFALTTKKDVISFSIGGSIRETNFKFENYSRNFSKKLVNDKKRITYFIGNRDGNFENFDSSQFLKKKNLYIYKGHHYITDEAIAYITKNLDVQFKNN